MKRITSMLSMLCISFSLMANNHLHERGTNVLINLLPDKVTTDRVRDIYGEATITTVNHKTNEEYWQYKTDNEDFYLRWDTETGALKSLAYNTHVKATKTWSNRYLAPLEMKVSTPKDASDALGAPSNLYVQHGETELRYAFVGATVDLVFRKGVLTNIRVYEAAKSDVNITVE